MWASLNFIFPEWPRVVLICSQRREGMLYMDFFFLNLYDKSMKLYLSNVGLMFMSNWCGNIHLWSQLLCGEEMTLAYEFGVILGNTDPPYQNWVGE